MIKTYWQQLSPREQRIVSAAAAFVFISLFYFVYWQPLQDNITMTQTRIEAQTSNLQTMQSMAARIQQQSNGASRRSVSDSSSMLAIIERTANQKQLKSSLQKIQPEGQGGVRIWLEDIAFDDLVSWLDLLDSKHGITVSDISLERDAKAGLVDGRILLQVAM